MQCKQKYKLSNNNRFITKDELIVLLNEGDVLCIKKLTSLLTKSSPIWKTVLLLDLASFTLFRQGMIMITDSMVFLKAFPNQSLFQTYQNEFQDIPESPNYSKKQTKKKPKCNHSSKKRGGGVRRGMIRITDSMGFFLTPSLIQCIHIQFNVH